MITENQACAPSVTAGHQYNLGVYYMSSSPNAVIEVYRHDVRTGWQFWMDLKNLPADRQLPGGVRADARDPGRHQPDLLRRRALRHRARSSPTTTR